MGIAFERRPLLSSFSKTAMKPLAACQSYNGYALMGSMLQRLLTVAVLGVVITAPFQAKTPYQKWTKYTYAEDGFAIKAPSAPSVLKKPNGVRVYVVQLGQNSTFNIHVGETTGSETQCAAMLTNRQLRDQENSLQPIFPGTMKEITIAGHPGLQYENKMEINQATYRVIWREYCVGNKGFFLGFFYPINQPKPAVANRLLNSFSLLGK
jgi:hypothetical protein